jgi:hypothetical protein
MTETLASTADNTTTATNVDMTLMSLRVKEEQACAGYLAARRAMMNLARLTASLRQLSAEQPTRVDYRDAFYKALDDYNHAGQRTRLAYNRWVRAQLRTDSRWTDTEGRNGGARTAGAA